MLNIFDAFQFQISKLKPGIYWYVTSATTRAPGIEGDVTKPGGMVVVDTGAAVLAVSV
jgi:hypothetical protein